MPKTESPWDSVEHPKHYTYGKVECIDFIESWDLGFHLGNAVKYIYRAGKKNPSTYKEDLEKALWYLKRHIRLYPPGETHMRMHDPIMVSDFLNGCGVDAVLHDVIDDICFRNIRDAATLLEHYIEAGV